MLQMTQTVTNSVFAEPRRLTGEANRALQAWQSTTCALLQESWATLLGTDITLATKDTDSASASRAVGKLTDPGYAARMEIGPHRTPSLFALSSRTVLTLVNNMLGVEVEEWPEPRDLTPVETSMVELLFGEIAKAVSQAWPDVDLLGCELYSVVARPMRSRIIPPDDAVVRTKIRIDLPLGEEEAVWLIPRDGLKAIGISECSEEGRVSPAPQMRFLAEALPKEVTVRLGETSMSLSELDRLSVGDYLTLEQSVRQPLEMTVDGHLHWLGHPCRLGNRQGFEIIASKKD